MKTDLHPKYHKNIKITCSCGNVFLAGSTLPEIKTEICSACHPFYTGQQKLIDTAGRVDKFMERVKKAQTMKEKQVKKVDKDLDKMFEEEVKVESKEKTPKVKPILNMKTSEEEEMEEVAKEVAEENAEESVEEAPTKKKKVA